MSANNSADIDWEHPIFEAFRAVGFPPKALTDPAFVEPEDIEESDGTWLLVQWKPHGIEMFDVDTVEETDRGGITHEVPFGNNASQPIGFADEYDPLNSEIRPMSQLRGMSNENVTFFVSPDHRPPEYPGFSETEAAEALEFWGSEGWFPRGAAEALVAAVGGDPDSVYTSDDPDVEGLEIARASGVAEKMASAAGVYQSADSGITGHKKTRRQEFYRNKEALEERVGIDRDE